MRPQSLVASNRHCVLFLLPGLWLGACVPTEHCAGDDCSAVSRESGGAGGSGAGGAGALGGGGGLGGSGGSAGVGGEGTISGGVGGTSGGVGGSDASDSGSALDAGNGSSACGACPIERPHCSVDECVACVEDIHCEAGACIEGKCSPCRDDAQCTEPDASHCTSAHECAACESSIDCIHLENTPICDAGLCVECTAQDWRHCGVGSGGLSRVCDVLSRTCSDETIRSANLCDPCVSDDQCERGQLCVMHRFDEIGDDEGEVDAGWFCFWREDADEMYAPQGSCARALPYVDTRESSRSIGGVEATVCTLRLTTCAGNDDFSVKPCAGLGDDAVCGDPRFLSDASCAAFSSMTYLCTVPCGSRDDCDPRVECIDGPPNLCEL